ncbi:MULTISPECIES: hypothetical protein [unclassified Tychonema]|nr:MULTISPECIES: hypothetical protein [unclassified Tychonema]
MCCKINHKEEGRRKREEGRRKKEGGRRKREEGLVDDISGCKFN